MTIVVQDDGSFYAEVRVEAESDSLNRYHIVQTLAPTALLPEDWPEYRVIARTN